MSGRFAEAVKLVTVQSTQLYHQSNPAKRRTSFLLLIPSFCCDQSSNAWCEVSRDVRSTFQTCVEAAGFLVGVCALLLAVGAIDVRGGLGGL